MSDRDGGIDGRVSSPSESRCCRRAPSPSGLSEHACEAGRGGALLVAVAFDWQADLFAVDDVWRQKDPQILAPVCHAGATKQPTQAGDVA